MALEPTQYKTTEEEKTIKVRASGGATPPVRYARTKQADFLAAVRTVSPASCQYGRELLHYGDFEDLDVDGEFHEGHFWARSSSAILENKVVRTGVGAMALLRTPLDRTYGSTWPAHEIHFKKGADLTLTGFRKGESAGRSQILIQWYDGGGDVISTTVEHRRDPGTYDWERFTLDLTPPGAAESLKFYLRHHPPDGGAKGEGPEGRVFFDDIALVQWEGFVDDASPGFALPQPNNWSWLRFRPLEGSAATVEAHLTHKVFTPAAP